MNDFQWAQLLGLWQIESDRREKACAGSLFVLRGEVGQRLDAIHALLEASPLELDVEEEFFPVGNSYGISISTWVVDGAALDLVQLLALADVYSIDAAQEGRLVLSLSLNDAADEWKEVAQ